MGKDLFKIAVTEYCNMNCIYCERHRNIDHDKPMEMLFSDKEILTFIRSATKAGARTIHITGGEPIVRPHFIDLLEWIRFFSAVDRVILSTNGSLLKPDVLQEVLKYIDGIHISLDANQAYDLQEITGLGECMNEILNAAWTASSLGIQTRITAMMIEEMMPHLAAISDFGKQRDFDICFKELKKDDYSALVKPVQSDTVLSELKKRYPDLHPVPSEDPTIDYYKTGLLKGRLGIVHTNMERDDMTYLDEKGVLHCGPSMRHKINLVKKLENGAKYEDFDVYFNE